MDGMFHKHLTAAHAQIFQTGLVAMWLYKLMQTLQQDFLPSHCLTCHAANKAADLLCSSCLYSIRSSLWACRHCGQPGTALADHCQQTTALHVAQAGLEYSGVTRDLIHRWKFHGAIELSHLLVQLALEAAPITRRYHALVPVPMHWRGRWGRGYNQSRLLAQVLNKEIGRQLQSPVTDCLKARPRKKAQHHMDRAQRIINSQGRYTTKKSFKGHSVLIVDDVVTTGATLDAVAETLAKAGAARIDAWCLARAP